MNRAGPNASAHADDVDERLADALISEARRPEEWLASDRASLYGAICEDRGRAHVRAQSIIAGFACAAAFLAGIWAASRGIAPQTPLRADERDVSEAVGPRAAPPPLLSDLTDLNPSRRGDGPRWQNIEFPGVGLIEVFGTTSYEVTELAAERQLRIGSGVLRAQIARQDPVRPLVVVAPPLRVVVVGTRFDLYSDGSLTRVELIEGHVRVESAGGVVELNAGEVVRSDDPRLLPRVPASPAPAAIDARNARPAAAERPSARGSPGPAPTARATTVEECSRQEPLASRKACYARLASGDSLAAQNALLALGSLAADTEREPDAALGYWRQLLTRFGDSTLAPEAGLHALSVLLQARRTDEAIRAAATFEERFGDDPRVPRVALVRARLLCGPAGERAAGRRVLDGLLFSADPVARADAAELLPVCQGPSFGPAGPGGLVPRDIQPGAPPGH